MKSASMLHTSELQQQPHWLSIIIPQQACTDVGGAVRQHGLFEVPGDLQARDSDDYHYCGTCSSLWTLRLFSGTLPMAIHIGAIAAEV